MLFFSKGWGPESRPLSSLWICTWTKSDTSTWCYTTAWMLMPSEYGHLNWHLFDKISMRMRLKKCLSFIWQSDASRNWLSPTWYLLENLKFEMTSIDTNDASCQGVMFHFDTSRAGISFWKGHLKRLESRIEKSVPQDHCLSSWEKYVPLDHCLS